MNMHAEAITFKAKYLPKQCPALIFGIIHQEDKNNCEVPPEECPSILLCIQSFRQIDCVQVVYVGA